MAVRKFKVDSWIRSHYSSSYCWFTIILFYVKRGHPKLIWYCVCMEFVCLLVTKLIWEYEIHGTYRIFKVAFHSVHVIALAVWKFQLCKGVPEWNTRHCVMQNNVLYHSPFVVIDRVRKRYLSCCSVFETSCEASANHILGFPVRHFNRVSI